MLPTLFNTEAPLAAARDVDDAALMQPLSSWWKGAWGGREYGAEWSLGRKGVWGGREYGAEGSQGRRGVWGGREYGAVGSMGRSGVWGGWEGRLAATSSWAETPDAARA